MLSSCENNNLSRDITNGLDNDTNIFSTDTIDLSTDTINLSILEFEISRCLKECNQDTGSILEKNIIGDTLYLEVGHFLNCAAYDTYLKDFKIEKDIIDLILKRPHTLELWNNRIVEMPIGEETTCHCYFKLKCKIAGINNNISMVLINGHKLENCGD